jgi:hypothetical protein
MTAATESTVGMLDYVYQTLRGGDGVTQVRGKELTKQLVVLFLAVNSTLPHASTLYMANTCDGTDLFGVHVTSKPPSSKRLKLTYSLFPGS